MANLKITPEFFKQLIFKYIPPPKSNIHHYEQWSPNYGPRAGSGLPPHLVRPPEQYQRRVPIYYFFHLAHCR